MRSEIEEMSVSYALAPARPLLLLYAVVSNKTLADADSSLTTRLQGVIVISVASQRTGNGH